MHDLRAGFAQVWVDWTLVAGTPRLEGPRCNVVLQEFVIDDVDDGRYQLLDVF